MDLSHEAWVLVTAMCTGVLTLVGVVVSAFFAYKAQVASKSSEAKAGTAVELSRPTGSGWADRAEKKLDHLIRITYETKKIAELALDEITEHKNSHVAAQLGIPIRRVK